MVLLRGDGGVRGEDDCGVLGGVVEGARRAGVQVEAADGRALSEDLDPYLRQHTELDCPRGEPWPPLLGAHVADHRRLLTGHRVGARTFAELVLELVGFLSHRLG